MMTDTLVAEKSNVRKDPIEAYCLDDGDCVSLFDVYLEFILFWLKSDSESYRNAGMMPSNREKKDFLESMALRKSELFKTFSAYRGTGHKDWFESTLCDKTSLTDFFLENTFNPLVGWKELFYFAYRKEYASLAIFEKANRSDLEPAIHTLLESAAEHELRHILYLDSRFFDITQIPEPASQYFHTEGKDEQWALITPSE